MSQWFNKGVSEGPTILHIRFVVYLTFQVVRSTSPDITTVLQIYKYIDRYIVTLSGKTYIEKIKAPSFSKIVLEIEVMEEPKSNFEEKDYPSIFHPR